MKCFVKGLLRIFLSIILFPFALLYIGFISILEKGGFNYKKSKLEGGKLENFLNILYGRIV